MVGYINTQVLSDQNLGAFFVGLFINLHLLRTVFVGSPQSLMGGLDGEEMQTSFLICL